MASINRREWMLLGAASAATGLSTTSFAVLAPATVLVDEAYVEYLDPAERASMVDLVRAGANVVVVRTFSKIYGLAGARVGYTLARPDLVERLRRFQVGNLNRFGYAAAMRESVRE